MRVPTPHYLLFSESQPQTGQTSVQDTGGRWRFVLESIDGSTQFAAADDEREVPRERLDLLAVVRGLEALDQPSHVTLVTPSRYINRGIRFGLDHWRENDWRWESFGEMAPVPNADLWRRVDRAMGIHEVRCRAWKFESSPDAGQPITATDDSSEPDSAGTEIPGQDDRSVHQRTAARPFPKRSRPVRSKLSRIRLLIGTWCRRLWVSPHDGQSLPSCC